MLEGLYKIGERFLGKKFLQGNSFIDFIKDGFRLFVFMFFPWILLGFVLITQTLIQLLIGG